MPRYWGAARLLQLTTSNAKRAACVLVAFVLLQLLLSLLWKPPLNDIHGRRRPATTQGEPYKQHRSILDGPDEGMMEDDCMSLLQDTQRISSSVRQELQVLEDQRRQMAKQVLRLFIVCCVLVCYRCDFRETCAAACSELRVHTT